MNRDILVPVGVGAGVIGAGLLAARYLSNRSRSGGKPSSGFDIQLPSLPGLPAVGVLQDPEAGGKLLVIERPPGPSLVVFADETRGAGTFRVTAESAANILGAEEGVARDGQGLLDAFDRAPSGLSRVIMAGHGGPTQFLRPGTSGLRIAGDALRRWVSVPTLIRAAAPKLARRDLIWSFAGCRAGADPNEPNWSVASDRAGGAHSLAAAVRDAIVREVGDIPGGEVLAKSTTGTSFGNPMGRIFPIAQEFVGRPGVPLIDAVWGHGSSLNPELARAWRNAGARDPKMAMGWTLGSGLPSPRRPS